MKTKGKLLLLCLLAVICFSVLVGCGGEKGEQKVVKVYNWGDYIDPQVLKDFEKDTGIKVIYDTFATNEDMYVKIKSGGGDYDVAIPSDYMIKRMINEGLLEKIDFANVPNYKNIDKQFKDLSFDPKNEYSVPYMWGTVGIVYNKKMVQEPVDSWGILWDPKYKKQILMLDSPRDSIGLTLQYLGYSLNTKNDQELAEAKAKLIEQKDLVLAYVVDEVKDKMIGEEAALAVVWSGDAAYVKKENPDLEYAIPKEGTNLWFDSIVIPKGAKHKKEAEQFINYLASVDAAYKNADYIGYSTPIQAAKAKLPLDVQNDLAGYPAASILQKTEVFDDLASVVAKYDRIWTEIKAAH
ncbi:MAG: PotD/PotF family extracellular solute-binding protein [bacterium]